MDVPIITSIFTKILHKESPGYIIDETENFFAILDKNPVNPGHTLVIPKLEIDNIFDLPDELYTGIFVYAKNIAQLVQKATHSNRVGLAVEGFRVPHVHIHIVPIYHSNELNPERARPASEIELLDMYKKIISAKGS